ncbi:class I SAM-dependent methyltransferase [Candidatus Micrarchaeota archaeon]|nr:class I SAM-dependent methyltransferase [Candidatus Micrarchaeota archaeon]
MNSTGGKDIRKKVRKVLSSMGLKQQPFYPERHYSAEKLKEIDALYRLAGKSIGAKKKFSDAVARTEIEAVSDSLATRVEDLAFFLSKKPRKGQKVLDIASGSTITPMVAERLTKAEYHAVDLSREMLKQSEKLGSSRVSKAQGLAEKLPYKSGVFNEVWMENPDRLEGESIREAHRVLKPGGVFKIVIHIDKPIDKIAFGKAFNSVGFSVEIQQLGAFTTIKASKK